MNDKRTIIASPSFGTKKLAPPASADSSINICFLDGHTQVVSIDDLWQQQWHRNWQGKPMHLARP